ncbi:MAG: CYTH domain-containing protein [Desulfovibrio sp.]|jgi:adenylate cyclase|nr:CYTH domain-containing protein [Desulfovibrio sp.]
MTLAGNNSICPPEFTEIERKFLPAHDGWRTLPATRLHIRQGYLNLDPERTVRVRLCEEIQGIAPPVDPSDPLREKNDARYVNINDYPSTSPSLLREKPGSSPAGRGFLTVKGKSRGATRAEFEFPIPVREASTLLETLALRPFVEKIRHCVELPPHVWEIDEFIGENLGLVLIEIELDNCNTPLLPPNWVGTEVTGDPRYANASLVLDPFARRRA